MAFIESHRSIAALQEKRQELLREMHSLKGDNSTEAADRVLEIDREVAKLEGRIEHEQDIQNDINSRMPRRDIRQNDSLPRNAPAQFKNVATGEAIQAYQPHENLTPPESDIHIGRFVQGLLTGDTSGLSNIEAGALHGGSDSGGGYIVPTSMSTRVVDLARSASVALRAGVQTLPMTTAEMAIARLTQDPTAHWRPETVAVTSSDLAFDKVVLRAKTLAAVVPISLEMLEDSSNAAEVIQSALRQALGLALDQAILNGSGSESQPLGIIGTSGINEVSSVGTPTGYSQVTTAVKNVLTANYDGDISRLAWIMHPRDGATYDGLTDQQDQPLRPTPWAGELRQLMTTSLPSTDGGGSNESTMLVGDFSQVVLGARTSGVVIRVLDSGSVTDSSGTTWNAASQLMRLVVAHLRADVAVLRPTWLTKLTGVTA